MKRNEPFEHEDDLAELTVSRRIFQSLQDDDAGLEDRSGLPRIKDYLVLRRIGGGGGGDVFLAVRKGADRPLAIKLLRSTLAQGAAHQRAWRELDVLSELRLSCVPRVLDHGVYEGRLYFVTEYVQGLRLAEHCQKLSLREKVELLAKVADAVHSLHEHAVLHRDIKPSNVLINQYGQPVIIDLGIARLLENDAAATITESDVPLGSPAFMAPEQARGDRGAISTRSDVYGLGALAMMILCGQPPHSSDSGLHELIRRVGQEPARPPRTIDPGLPRPLSAVIAKATSFMPEMRYASAAEFAADLRRWLGNEPVRAASPSILSRINLYRKRKRAAFAMTVLAIIAILTAIAAGGWGFSEAQLRSDAEQLAAEKQELADEREAFATQQAALMAKLKAIAATFVRDASAAYGQGEIDRASRILHGLGQLMPEAAASDQTLNEKFQMTRSQVLSDVARFLYPRATDEQLRQVLEEVERLPADTP